MNNLIDISIGGIKCDNETCDFNDEDVKMEDYLQWLNKPCPKCDENLLTDADMQAANQMISMAGMLNSIGDDFDDFLKDELQ